MRKNRILTARLHAFLTEPSPTRDPIIAFVRAHMACGTRSVALCFRGTAATLYYRCHQLLRIRGSRTGVVGEFDFRHARFTKDYKGILETLRALGVDTSRFSDVAAKNAQKYLIVPLSGKEAVPCEAIDTILLAFMALIDDFLDPALTAYAFDIGPARNKSAGLEKDRQQQLYAAYFLKNDLLYYDLEYAEPYAEQSGVHGRFDLLGLRREGDFYSLLFTELKSTRSACGGKAGIADHEKDYLAYLSSVFIENRKKEACETVKLLCEIFGVPFPANLTPDRIQTAKIKFVFSDTAIPVGARYAPADARIERAYLCPDCGLEKPYENE